MFYKIYTSIQFSSSVIKLFALKAELIKKQAFIKNAYSLSF